MTLQNLALLKLKSCQNFFYYVKILLTFCRGLVKMSEKLLTQTEQNFIHEDFGMGDQGTLVKRNGSSRRHNLINTNTIIAIGSRVRSGKYEIYSKDMCVKLGRDFISCPDVVVVAGEPRFLNGTAEILMNPTLIVEVFSKETVCYDKTVKLERCLATESVKEVLLISEDEMRVEHYFKQNQKQWIYRIYDTSDGVISLESINCRISVSEIYSQVRAEVSSVDSQAVN